MKVLFVCVANVGRSQAAEALFNQLSGQTATSAGTRADEVFARTNPPTRSLGDTGSTAVPFMKKQGVDISGKTRKQLTGTMVQEADKVIVMADRDSWPDFLQDSNKVTYWDITDPVGLGDDAALSIYNEIKWRVEELVRKIG